jgi:hypothetical protein
MSVEALLHTRETTHGSFANNAHVAQALKALFHAQPAWSAMPEQHREALDIISSKLGRIFSGQATFYDHWRDIAGYATLAELACPKPEPPLVSLPSGIMDAAGQWHNRCDS